MDVLTAYARYPSLAGQYHLKAIKDRSVSDTGYDDLALRIGFRMNPKSGVDRYETISNEHCDDCHVASRIGRRTSARAG